MPEETNPQATLMQPGPADRDEQRAVARYPCQLLSSLRALEQAAPPWPAHSRDISTGGISLVVARRFEPGTMLILSFHDELATWTRSLLIQVVRVVERESGGWLLGCILTRQLDDAEVTNLSE